MTLQRPPHQDCSWMITELHSNFSLPLVIEVNGESFFSGRWEEFSLKNASFQFRAPPSYQLNLMRRCTATFLQKGNWTVYKNALTESSHRRHREWKGSRIYVYTHTHTYKGIQWSKQSGMWQGGILAILSPSDMYTMIFTAAVRMPGRLHPDTSKFPFWAQCAVL